VVREGRAIVTARELADEERIAEIARMRAAREENPGLLAK
jgi:hypothetical protein